MKKLLNLTRSPYPLLKFDLKMKLSTLFIVVTLFTMQANETYAQRTKITLELDDITTRHLLDEIENTTEFRFVYKLKDVDLARLVSINVKNERIEKVLNRVFGNTGTDFNIIKKRIFLTRKEAKAADSIEPIKRANFQPVLQNSINGTVTDANGTPLPGANIIEKGTTNGVQSDFDGNFSLDVADENAILIVSYIGFASKEVPINGQSNLTITLEESSAGLDEVVVIGYGTVRKKDLTGSVSSIDAEEAFVAPVSNLDQAIQGRAAGVFVTSQNGAPGTGTTIRIRGGNSITAGNEPLYVVDGFIGGGNLNTINPNDIESIEILKDASSTAIYGARGANGVILITTKKGKVGKFTVNLRTSQGVQVLPEKIDVQTGREFAEYRNKATPGLFDLNNLPGEETDWQEELSRPGFFSDHQVAVSGGSEKTQHYSSFGYFTQEGIIKGSGFERFALRTNIDHTISNVFKVGVNLSLTRSLTDNALVIGAALVREDPLKPAFDENGDYSIFNIGLDNDVGNLLADAELNTNRTILDRTLINSYIETKLAKGLTLRNTFGGDFTNSKLNQFTPSNNPSLIIEGRLGNARIAQSNTTSLLNENTLNYAATFGDHSLTVLFGATVQKSQTENTDIVANEIPSNSVEFNAVELAPVEETRIGSGYSEFGFTSLLGRINYSYKDRYLFTASARRDGSSRLGANNKYAVFPSAAVAWKVSEENFLKESDAVDLLKIRASYGETGNSGIDPFSTLPLLATGGRAVFDGVGVTGVSQSSLANPNLKWETTKQFDVGLEASFFNGRLTAEIDYYYKRTEDLLLEAEVPFFTGFQTQILNVGTLENRGIDFNLGVVLINNENFRWSTDFNISTNTNEVLDLGGQTAIVTNRLSSPSGDITSQLVVGQPVGTFWGSFYEGVDPATGDAIFRDIGGPDGVPDGVIDENDKGAIGSANPDFFGGFQNNFTYKNFDLQAFFQFTVGNENYNRDVFQVNGIQLNSYAKLRENIWTPENPNNASIPGFNSVSLNTSNSLYVQNASFLRLKTLQMGYTIPLSKFKWVNQFRITLTGTNLFLIKDKDYLGFDPEANSFGTNNTLRGFDNINYPQNRSYLLGLDITF